MKKILYMMLTGVFCFNSTQAHVSTINSDTSPEEACTVGVSVGPSGLLNLKVVDPEGAPAGKFTGDGGHYGGQAAPVYLDLNWETTGNCAITTVVEFGGVNGAEYDLSDKPVSILFAPYKYLEKYTDVIDSDVEADPSRLVTISGENRGLGEEFAEHGDIVIPGILNVLVNNGVDNHWAEDSNLTYLLDENGVPQLTVVPFLNSLAYREGPVGTANAHTADEKKHLARSIIIKYIPGIDSAHEARSKKGSDLYELSFFYESDDLYKIPGGTEYKLSITSTMIDIASDPDHADKVGTDYSPAATTTNGITHEDSVLLGTFDDAGLTGFSDLYTDDVYRNVIETYKE